MAIRGSCLCKTVQYEIDGLDTPVRHCHCTTCRKTHAAVYNTGAGVARERFRWISGEDKLSSYESSPGKLRRFCSKCGTHVVADSPSRPVIVVRVATLDEDPGKKPSEHIWTSETPQWLIDAEDAKAYPEWYPGR